MKEVTPIIHLAEGTKVRAPWALNGNASSFNRQKITAALKDDFDGAPYTMRIAELARSVWDIANGRIPGASVSNRLDAIKMLMDRIDGPVRQEIEAGPPGSFDAMKDLTDENLDTIMSYIRTVRQGEGDADES